MKQTVQKCLIFFCIILLTNCKKNIKADIKTNLMGLTSDPLTQLPISNASIYVHEYKTGMYGPVFSRTVDSTKSGSDGRYNFSFATTGHGVEYRLAFLPTVNYYILQDAQKINIGTDNTINFFAYKIHTLKARVIITSNPNPPLRVYSNISSGSNNISATTNDSTVFLQVIPNFDNYIYFNITNVDTPGIYNARIDTLFLPGFTDTFTHTFQVDPTLFQRRL